MAPSNREIEAFMHDMFIGCGYKYRLQTGTRYYGHLASKIKKISQYC
jgi:hypothetical protein